MTQINLTANDKINLKLASQQKNAWQSLSTNAPTTKKTIKDYIKKINTIEDQIYCCYCRRSFLSNRNDEFDIEHILPSSVEKFKRYSFSFKNLNISCSRCNRNIKGNSYTYFKPTSRKCFLSKNYGIIHPNLDNYKIHLNILDLVLNNNKILLYKIVNNSKKGMDTYKFFKLDELVRDEIRNGLNRKRVSFEEVYEKIATIF